MVIICKKLKNRASNYKIPFACEGALTKMRNF